MSEAFGLYCVVSDKFRREHPGITGRLIKDFRGNLESQGVAVESVIRERDCAVRQDEYHFVVGDKNG